MQEDTMKRMTYIMTVMALVTVLTACGGGGGGESQEMVAATDSAPVARIAAVIAGPETALYTISLLDSSENSYAIALNDAGQIIGHYSDANRQLSAFSWQDNTVKTVVNNGQVSRINNHGQIVGWQDLAQSEAFLYEADGKMVQLNTLGGASRALAINDSGQTAGRITLGTEKSFVDQNGAMQFIAKEIDGYAIAMNNNGDVLILEVKGNSSRTLLWRNGSLTDLGDFGGALTMGRDINDAGQVVGWAQTASGDYHPFLWDDGVMTDLSTYTGNFGAAVAINEAGVMLLKASDMKGERNLLLDHGTVTDLGNFGSSYAVANDLNSRGQIVGWMADARGVMHAFLATPKS
jgi:probable HAF family extracellular repeat protein